VGSSVRLRPGHQRWKSSASWSLRTRVRTWSSRWAPGRRHQGRPASLRHRPSPRPGRRRPGRRGRSDPVSPAGARARRGPRRPHRRHPRCPARRRRPGQPQAHHRRGGSARSTSSPARSCSTGSATGAPGGRTPPTRTCSSTSTRRWAPGRSAPIYYAKTKLRGQAATLERLRVDRQLEEARAHGPDPLRLAAVFGLDPKTAIRYAASARMLLSTRAEEQDPASSREPKGQNHP
jgi:hypothetical protein